VSVRGSERMREKRNWGEGGWMRKMSESWEKERGVGEGRTTTRNEKSSLDVGFVYRMLMLMLLERGERGSKVKAYHPHPITHSFLWISTKCIHIYMPVASLPNAHALSISVVRWMMDDG